MWNSRLKCNCQPFFKLPSCIKFVLYNKKNCHSNVKACCVSCTLYIVKKKTRIYWHLCVYKQEHQHARVFFIQSLIMFILIGNDENNIILHHSSSNTLYKYLTNQYISHSSHISYIKIFEPYPLLPVLVFRKKRFSLVPTLIFIQYLGKKA